MPTSWNSSKRLQYSALAQVGLGIGEVVGGYINGEIEDKLGVKYSFYSNILQFTIAFTLLLYSAAVNEFCLWQAFLLYTAWGMADSGVNIFTACIAGFQFRSVTIPFSIFVCG
jgi:predicted MFS family arabinose efflux permease